MLAGSRQIIRDENGHLIGVVVQTTQRYEARDAHGRLLGYYQNGVTRSAQGRKLAQGNILSALIWNAQKRRKR